MGSRRRKTEDRRQRGTACRLVKFTQPSRSAWLRMVAAILRNFAKICEKQGGWVIKDSAYLIHPQVRHCHYYNNAEAGNNKKLQQSDFINCE